MNIQVADLLQGETEIINLENEILKLEDELESDSEEVETSFLKTEILFLKKEILISKTDLIDLKSDIFDENEAEEIHQIQTAQNLKEFLESGVREIFFGKGSIKEVKEGEDND